MGDTGLFLEVLGKCWGIKLMGLVVAKAIADRLYAAYNIAFFNWDFTKNVVEIHELPLRFW